MHDRQMLQFLINERLSEAAGQILELFDKAVAEYQREIFRLTNGSDAERVMVDFRDPQMSIKGGRRTGAARQEDEDDAGCFQCEEETAQVVVKLEDEPQMPIRNVRRVGGELPLHPRGQQETSSEDMVTPGAALNEENAGSFNCKEETEQVIITREDVHPMMITNIKSLNKRDRQQRRTNSEWPEASGAAESDTSAESNPDAEAEDSDTGVHDHPFGFDLTTQPFSTTARKKGFRQRGGVQMHMKRLHTDEEPFTSADCNAQLDGQQGSPLQPDTEDRPFCCTVCGMGFTQMYSLEVHMRDHDGQSLFKCTECSVAFTKQAKFFRHMKAVHSIEKPFKCLVCNKCLKTAHAYRTHMLIHTGERPFKCSVCGRGFVQKVSLKNHMVTHTGEKPFTCSECGKNYSTSQSLMIHMRLVHR